jgi:hypothetical protein
MWQGKVGGHRICLDFESFEEEYNRFERQHFKLQDSEEVLISILKKWFREQEVPKTFPGPSEGVGSPVVLNSPEQKEDTRKPAYFSDRIPPPPLPPPAAPREMDSSDSSQKTEQGSVPMRQDIRFKAPPLGIEIAAKAPPAPLAPSAPCQKAHLPKSNTYCSLPSFVAPGDNIWEGVSFQKPPPNVDAPCFLPKSPFPTSGIPCSMDSVEPPPWPRASMCG